MKYKIWNKKDKINGVEAKHFLSQGVFKACKNDIILIYENDNSNMVSQIECKDILGMVYQIDATLPIDEFMKQYQSKLEEARLLEEQPK